MKLRLQTDYALRTLMFLAHVDRRSTADEIAETFGISRDHLVKVVQQLARMGYVRTYSGRGGGLGLARKASDITVRDIVATMEGTRGLLECLQQPDVCPLEPGCHLRTLLMQAEDAFYDALSGVSIYDLCRGAKAGGFANITTK